ncbi:MAG TPA: methionyl-tRNA formyltransferase, partial [Verrucomicrobia bacterium]|nr:methionyl-tRNA formyltransferase [Verrucomicrobiota bacterium]
WPGIFTQLPIEKNRLLNIQAAEISSTKGNSGEVLFANEKGIVIGCGEQSLNLLKLQREGSRPLNVAEFLNGCPLQAGQRLG